MKTALLLLACLCTLLAPLTADAGSWSYEILGPGETPGTVLVAITIGADFSGECPGYDACFVIGGFSAHVSPAPPDQDHSCVESETPDETGTSYSLLCVAGDGSTTWEIELTQGSVYTLSTGQSHATWTTSEQGGGCDFGDTCTKVDEEYSPLQINTGSVPIRDESWAGVKSRY